MAHRRKKPEQVNRYDPELKKIVFDKERYKGSPWTDHWRDDLTNLGKDGCPALVEVNDKLPRYLKHELWAIGDVSVLEAPFIVAFSGRSWGSKKPERDLGKDIITRMSAMGLVPIHGNIRGVERNSARYLREQHGKQILVPPYGPLEFKNIYGERMRNGINRGHVLVLSPFKVHAKEEEDSRRKRSIFIADLADAMIATQVTDESGGGYLARQMLRRGKPVYLTEAEGREKYCVDDHNFFKRLGAEEFKLAQLDSVIKKIKESKGYK